MANLDEVFKALEALDGGSALSEAVKDELQKKNSEAKNLRERLKGAEGERESLLRELGGSPEEIKKIVEEHKRRADESKTELQRAQEAAQEARAAREAAEAKLGEREEAIKAAEIKALRLKVAASHGLPVGMADRLIGETEEELSRDAADNLLPFMNKDGTKNPKAINSPANPANPKNTDTASEAYQKGVEEAKKFNERQQQAAEARSSY